MLEPSKFETQATHSSHKRKSGSPDAADVPRATVLIVSNDDMLRTKARSFLESEGILVFSSADVQCASEVVFCARDVNVLIVDEDSLGARRGMELAAELSNSRPRSSVIILTGVQAPIEVFQTIHLRGWKALRNPLPLAILLGVIRQVLGVQNGSIRQDNRNRLRRSAEVLAFPPPVPYVRPSGALLRKKNSLELVRREGEL